MIRSKRGLITAATTLLLGAGLLVGCNTKTLPQCDSSLTSQPNAASELCYSQNTGDRDTAGDTVVNGDVDLRADGIYYLLNGQTGPGSDGAKIASPSGTINPYGKALPNYHDFYINGCVRISAPVAFYDSTVKSGDRCTKPTTDTSGAGAALVNPGENGFGGGTDTYWYMWSNTLNGLNVDSSTGVARACLELAHGEALRLDIQGCTHDVWADNNATLNESYIHDPTFTYFPSNGTYLHRNDIMVDGATNIGLFHNFAKQTLCGSGWCDGATSAISMLDDWGGDHNIVVESNYVMGGSNYDMYGGSPLGTNITIKNNAFAPWGYSGVGTGTQIPTAHGTGVPYANCNGVIDICSGNVNAETGAPVNP